MKLITQDNWIYQSNKLIESSYSLTTLEQKLIRVLASMINRSDENFKEYNFSSKELAKLFGKNQKSIYKEIENIATTLMKRTIKIKNKEKEKFLMYHFIDVASYENGVLSLKINPEMREFYLHLEQYTKYQLKNILRFKYQYSFKIYELLKQYERITERDITIEELKFILDIEKEYGLYASIKQRILLPSQQEINEKTDLIFEFAEIRKQRKVHAIKLKIIPKTREINTLNEEVSVTLDFIKEIKAEFKNLYNGNLDDSFINAMIEKKGIESVRSVLRDLKDYIGQTKIKNIERFFYSCVMDGYSKSTSSNRKSSHANFNQREYSDEQWEDIIKINKEKYMSN